MFLKSKIRIIPRRIIGDDRGWFLKVIDGKEEGLPNQTGEIYLTSGKEGQSKGGHYHDKASEWFTLVSGSCDLLLEDVQTNEKMVINLCSTEPKTIYVPKGIAHIFENTSNVDFLLLAYTDYLYDPQDTMPYSFLNFNNKSK
jgi:dTDP-4-dehydrorhamnose 3,5-epimerase-like enzyme